MTTLSVSQVQRDLEKIMDEASLSHEPVQINGTKTSAVLMAEEDWRAVQVTLHLHSIPGMRESIRRGLQAPIKECAEKLPW